MYFRWFCKACHVKVWFYQGFRRFLKPNVVFPKVLKGFWWKTLVLCRFWKVLGVKCCISLGFERFLMEIFGFMQVLEGFWSHMLYYVRFWMVLEGSRASKPYQSLQTIQLHYQIDALWTILELKASRSTRASKPLLFIIKSMLWEAFRSSSPQSSWSTTFHYQINVKCKAFRFE